MFTDAMNETNGAQGVYLENRAFMKQKDQE